MSFSHRKLLPEPPTDANVDPSIPVAKKLDCPQCVKCSDKCKEGLDGAYSPPSPPPPPPPQSHKSQMPSVLIVMLCVLGAALIFLSYLTILRRLRSSSSNSRRRNIPAAEGNHQDFVDENHGPEAVHPIWYINTVGLEQSIIDSIAVFKYKKGEGLVEGSECSVCLSEFEDDESLRLLPKCSHAFHIPCIDRWLRSHKNCPLCRAPVVRETSTDAAEVTTVELVLSDSGSEEDNPVDDQRERNDVGEGATSQSQTMTRVETVSPSPNEDCNSKMDPHHSSARNGRNRVLSDLASHQVRVDEELQPIRRSISMDFTAASNIYAAVAKIHPVEEEGSSNFHQGVGAMKKQTSDGASKPGDQNKLIIHRPRKSFTFGLSLQKVPIRMKRSVSSNGKLSQPTHSRSQEVVQAPSAQPFF